VTDINELSFDDEGKRRDHLMDLHKLWTDGLSILLTQMSGSPTDIEKERQVKIENAIELLEAYLLKDYAFNIEFGKVIDQLPKIKDEKDNQADGHSD